jgi:hypothetical protein
MRRVPIRLVIVGAIVALGSSFVSPVAAAGGPRIPTHSSAVRAVRPAPSQAAVARSLAVRVTSSAKLKTSVGAVEQVLARGGISTIRGKHTVVKGRHPLAPNRVSAQHAVVMALELWKTRGRGDNTLHDFARLLAAAKVRFAKHITADTLVMRFVNSWVRTARKQSKSPQAFVPLFLAAMAARRHPAIDLAKPFQPSAVHLSELETLLLWTAVERGVKVIKVNKKTRATGTNPAAMPVARAENESGPCSDVKKLMDEYAPLPAVSISPSGVKLTKASDLLKESLLAAVENYKGEQFKKSFATFLKLAKMLVRVHTTVLLFETTAVAVLADGASAAEPWGQIDQPTFGTAHFTFKARAGLSKAAEETLKSAQLITSPGYKAVRDCARAADIPWPNDVSDIAADIKNWRIKWSSQDTPTVVAVDPSASDFDAGNLRSHLKLSDTDPYSGYAKFVSKVLPDSHQGNASQPVVVEATQYVSASLEAFKSPDLEAIAEIVKAGMGLDEHKNGPDPIEFGLAITDSLVDILSNMTLAAAAPHATNYLNVVKHVACDANTQALLRAQVERQVAGPTCGPVYLKIQAASETGTWSATYDHSICGAETGTKTQSTTVGAVPLDPDFGILQHSSNGYSVASFDSGGTMVGSDTVTGCLDPPIDPPHPPCSITTPYTGAPGDIGVFLKVPDTGSTATLDWGWGNVGFNTNVVNVNPDCLTFVAEAQRDPLTSTAPSSDFTSSGPHTYTITRKDTLSDGGVGITGTETLSITLQRVNADGTPW